MLTILAHEYISYPEIVAIKLTIGNEIFNNYNSSVCIQSRGLAL